MRAVRVRRVVIISLPTGRRVGLLLLSICALALAGGAAAQEPARETAEERFVKKADELIHDNNYDVKSTPHYKVKTDDPRIDLNAAVELLESFQGFFEASWKDRAELLPFEEPSRFYLFYSRAKLKQLEGYRERTDALALIGRYQGFYKAVAIHTDGTMPEELPELLIHEASHQLVQRRLYGEGNVPSLWVAEGLASYFGHTRRDRSDGWLRGEIGYKDAVLIKGAGSGGRMGWSEVKAYRRALEKGDTLPLDTVLRTNDPDVYYDARWHERSMASWLLVHYLLHADGGAHVGGLVAFIKHDAAGDGTMEALYSDLGTTGERLASEFKTYVSQMKQR